jgi:hypothetical protein
LSGFGDRTSRSGGSRNDTAVTVAEFLDVFRHYNTATWPAPIVLPLVGLVCAWLLLSNRPAARRASLMLLAGLWTWTAVAYHIAFFASVNRAAYWFSAAFLLQAGMFLYASLQSRMTSPRVDANRFVGGAIIAFALVIYPALAYVAGHRYPAMPTFGLPCPTTIFTIGVLASLRRELPWQYAVVPLLWSVVGTSAALELGMTEDLSLGLAAIALLALMAARSRSTSPASAPAMGGAR